MQKNIASQKLIVFAFDATTNLPKSGDAANITAYYDLDWAGVTVLTDTSAAELDATNAKGYYQFDLTQGETNGNIILYSGKLSTSNVVVIAVPAVVQTVGANFAATVIDSSGNVAADVKKLLGTAWLTPGTAGTPDVNVKLWNALTTVELPLVPTTAGRKLDVSTGGEAGLDWANIGSPTTAQNLSATNIDVDQIVASVSGAVGSVTAGVTLAASAIQAIWDAATSALTTVGSIGKWIIDKLDVAVSTRLASASYTTPPTANQNADALLDRADAIETGITPRGALRIGVGADAGKTNGMDTATGHIRNVEDTKNRVTATLDGNGNRTATSVDVT